MPPVIDLQWPAAGSETLYRQLHRVVRAVAVGGGAVGWLVPPDRSGSQAWVDSVLRAVDAGDAALCVAVVDGQAEACGCWRRDTAVIFRHRAEVTKIMAHPDARGLGLGRMVTVAVVDHARRAGFETLHLGVRGNNHLAIALYEDLGFVECGRIPDVIEVGDLRFDEVRMYTKLPRPPGVVWCGTDESGPGGSPRPVSRRRR